jgi:hypothetical protein
MKSIIFKIIEVISLILYIITLFTVDKILCGVAYIELRRK